MALNLRLDRAKVIRELMALCHEKKKSRILIITNKDFFFCYALRALKSDLDSAKVVSRSMALWHYRILRVPYSATVLVIVGVDAIVLVQGH